MGFGPEILFFSVLGGLILGPKRLHMMLVHIARAKARFEETTRAFGCQLDEELGSKPRESTTKSSSTLTGVN